MQSLLEHSRRSCAAIIDPPSAGKKLKEFKNRGLTPNPSPGSDSGTIGHGLEVVAVFWKRSPRRSVGKGYSAGLEGYISWVARVVKPLPTHVGSECER